MHSFSYRKKCAINELLEMNQKSAQNQGFDANDATLHNTLNNNFSSIIFNILNSPDNLLIIGIIIILYQDCRDYLLFLALIYILL